MNRFEWNFSSTADIAIGAMLLAAILAVTVFFV
jgi:hypothetical protein